MVPAELKSRQFLVRDERWWRSWISGRRYGGRHAGADLTTRPWYARPPGAAGRFRGFCGRESSTWLAWEGAAGPPQRHKILVMRSSPSVTVATISSLLVVNRGHRASTSGTRFANCRLWRWVCERANLRLLRSRCRDTLRRPDLFLHFQASANGRVHLLRGRPLRDRRLVAGHGFKISTRYVTANNIASPSGVLRRSGSRPTPAPMSAPAMSIAATAPPLNPLAGRSCIIRMRYDKCAVTPRPLPPGG